MRESFMTACLSYDVVSIDDAKRLQEEVGAYGWPREPRPWISGATERVERARLADPARYWQWNDMVQPR